MSKKSYTSPSVTDPDVIPALINRLKTPEFREALKAFVDHMSDDKNFEFMWSYMKMVQLELTAVRADRTDDWDLHVNAFTRMLLLLE